MTVVHVEAMNLPDDAPPVDDGTVVNFAVRLFAKLDVGTLVFAPPPGMGVAVGRHEMSFQRLRERLPHQAGALPAEPRRAMWQALVDELATLHVRADAEMLMRLPFEVLLDDEARGILEGRGRTAD